MGRLGQFFRYKVFIDASEVMSIFNLPIDNRYFTLIITTFWLTLADASARKVAQLHASKKAAITQEQCKL